MTLSRGAKVQPKRSTLRSPAGFNAVCSSILRERAPTPPPGAQRYQRRQGNDQAVSIFESVRLGYPLGSLCLGDRVVHELDPERVEAVAGHEVIFPGFTRGRGLDALGDDQ